MNDQITANKERILANGIEGFDYQRLNKASSGELIHDFSSTEDVQQGLAATLSAALNAGIKPEEVALSVKRGILRSGTDLSKDVAVLVQRTFQGKSDEFVKIISDFSENIETNGLGARKEHLFKRPFQLSVEEGRELFLTATHTDVYPDSKRIKGVLSTNFDKARLAFYAHTNGGLNTMIRGHASDYLPKQSETQENSSIDLG